MASFSVFVRNMNKLANTIDKNTSLMVRRCALAVDQAVVVSTPVGNPDLWKGKPPKGYVGGLARSNWQVSINGTRSGTVANFGSGALASALAAAASVINGAGQGDAIHITNNLPYIERLNEGWSTQAPAGFVRLAINAGVDAVRAMKLTG